MTSAKTGEGVEPQGCSFAAVGKVTWCGHPEQLGGPHGEGTFLPNNLASMLLALTQMNQNIVYFQNL